MNILLTSVGRRTYLVDFFKKAIQATGGKIHAVNSHENAPALYHADEFEIAPPIYSKDYIPYLISYSKKNQIRAIVPLLDNDLPILAAERLAFEKLGIYVLVPSYELAKLSNDKYETFQFLKKFGFDVVPTFNTLDDFEKAYELGESKFPLIVKPRWGMGSLFTYEVNDGTELKESLEKAKEGISNTHLKHESTEIGREILIMEKIEGQEFMLDIINDLTGNHMVTVVNKKLLRKGGETEVAETVRDKNLMDLGQRIANLTKHPLVMDVDVIVNEKGAFILEFNPRFSGGYPFSHMAGVDLPQAFIKWLDNKMVDPQKLLNPTIGTRSMKGISLVVQR